MKIYTKTGDSGLTTLIGGTRVPKDHIRVACYGTIDELNSYIGLVRCYAISSATDTQLEEIQQLLFAIGAVLAADPEKSNMKLYALTTSDVKFLEKAIDQMDGELPTLKHFILPGGSILVSTIHIARCVCRRAERLVVQLASATSVPENVVIYLNRLSDYLFILARKMAKDTDTKEIIWHAR
ncbi:cob(I)yrinic acid a,c-diamide adenosyltransferase [Olivibacter ginsenosidimutans]|uniref:Corrinoid adenosyltransferase n=1 Tax=Olivibacter ginsenosidimutans TaxID=1176537 RepID=A0ABP9BEW0_9SPHI